MLGVCRRLVRAVWCSVTLLEGSLASFYKPLVPGAPAHVSVGKGPWPGHKEAFTVHCPEEMPHRWEALWLPIYTQSQFLLSLYCIILKQTSWMIQRSEGFSCSSVLYGMYSARMHICLGCGQRFDVANPHLLASSSPLNHLLLVNESVATESEALTSSAFSM